MNIRKGSSLGLALLLSATLLGACNKPADPAETAVTPPPETVQPAPAPAPAPVEPATAPEPVPAPAPAPAPKPKPKPKPQPAPQAYTPPAPQVCEDCGTIAAITPVKTKGEAGAMGTLAGAVIGGVIGHQFGGGKGKDVATVAGAAGGAMAGREVEKRARATTSYDITVSMENGSTRTVSVADPGGLGVGSRVRVSGNDLIPR